MTGADQVGLQLTVRVILHHAGITLCRRSQSANRVCFAMKTIHMGSFPSFVLARLFTKHATKSFFLLGRTDRRYFRSNQETSSTKSSQNSCVASPTKILTSMNFNTMKSCSSDEAFPIPAVMLDDFKPSGGMIVRIAKGACVFKLLRHPLQIITDQVKPRMVLIEKTPMGCLANGHDGTQITQTTNTQQHCRSGRARLIYKISSSESGASMGTFSSRR